MSDGLEERLRRIVVNQLGVRPDQVNRTAAFFEDLGADSLDLIELIMMVEEELCIAIPERKAERMTTFGHMLDYIDRQSGYRPCDDFTTRAGLPPHFYKCGGNAGPTWGRLAGRLGAGRASLAVWDRPPPLWLGRNLPAPGKIVSRSIRVG